MAAAPAASPAAAAPLGLRQEVGAAAPSSGPTRRSMKPRIWLSGSAPTKPSIGWPLLEGDDGRNRLDAELARDLRVVVDVHLDERDFAARSPRPPFRAPAQAACTARTRAPRSRPAPAGAARRSRRPPGTRPSSPPSAAPTSLRARPRRRRFAIVLISSPRRGSEPRAFPNVRGLDGGARPVIQPCDLLRPSATTSGSCPVARKNLTRSALARPVVRVLTSGMEVEPARGASSPGRARP